MSGAAAATAARRVLFLLPSIRGGGMERLVSILARALDGSSFSVELVVLHRRADNPEVVAGLPAGVRVTDLHKGSRFDVGVVARLAAHLRRTKPALAVGFMTYPNLLLLAAARLVSDPPPIIVTEHVTPDAMTATVGKRVQLRLAARQYRRAAAVVAVSEGLRGSLIARLALDPGRVRTIYNPFDPELDRLAEATQAPHPWLAQEEPVLVAAGRLAPQKAYPVLLEALARVREVLPARLLILGEGDERPALEALVTRLGLDGAVQFLGYVANPFPFMRDASAFVLSSDWETLGFVLVEASRVGAAIVSTDCEFGPNEIIEPGVSGLLVPPRDPRSLADAILRVLRDPKLAAALRVGARRRSELFAPSEAVARYTDLFEEAMRR